MKKLPNAPLKEVVFELKWQLTVNPETNQELDMGFDMAQGRFQNLVKGDFPVHKRRLPVGMPLEFMSYHIVHQFWAGEGEHPVLQLGPGIFSQNDTERQYEWESKFLPQLQKSLEYLETSYGYAPETLAVNLRYIDAIRLADYEHGGNWLGFVSEALKIRLENNFEPLGALKNFQINQSFLLENGSELNIVVSNGVEPDTNEPLLVWQTAVVHEGNMAWDDLLSWVAYAHETTHRVFESMTKGDFYDSFKKTNHG